MFGFPDLTRLEMNALLIQLPCLVHSQHYVEVELMRVFQHNDECSKQAGTSLNVTEVYYHPLSGSRNDVLLSLASERMTTIML